MTLRFPLGGRYRFPLIQLPRKSEVVPAILIWLKDVTKVSINSTSEEVRRKIQKKLFIYNLTFPLIQLPRKSEAFLPTVGTAICLKEFPLIQLPRKSEAVLMINPALRLRWFPLIQLPRKSEADGLHNNPLGGLLVSINSTSEEVRSMGLPRNRRSRKRASFH